MPEICPLQTCPLPLVLCRPAPARVNKTFDERHQRNAITEHADQEDVLFGIPNLALEKAANAHPQQKQGEYNYRVRNDFGRFFPKQAQDNEQGTESGRNQCG